MNLQNVDFACRLIISVSIAAFGQEILLFPLGPAFPPESKNWSSD